ncbi:MAG: ADP-ribosylglycohydrolase family protein [Haloferacaceae archaeon]
MTEQTRAVGALVGLACGDALGRPVEFRSSESVADEHGRVTEMLADGAHGQPAGTVTDDTEMALCLARSLADCRGFDADDVARRYADWLAGGPFDVGLLTADSIRRYDDAASPADAAHGAWADRPEGQNAGNGSLMRCAPAALAYADPDRLAEAAAAESRLTHADPRCVESCVALTRVVRELLDGASPEDALGAALSLAGDRDAPSGVRETLAVATEREARRENGGFVLTTLETALADALTAGSFEAAVVTSVSRGGDADTVGAVCGAVAGARFGADAVPARWADRVDEADECRSLARELAALDPS